MGRIFGAGAALGAMLAYFLDPQGGKRRRHVLGDRVAALMRRSARKSARGGRIAGAYTYGYAQRLRHLREEPKQFDDATLTRKVETELFRPADVPKGRISINAQNGVVQLRGEADTQEMIRDLVDKARRVQGVREVENLLHLPGTPAPMHR